MEVPDYSKPLPICFSDTVFPVLPKFPQIETPSFSVLSNCEYSQKFIRPNYYIHSIPQPSTYTSYLLTNSDKEFYDEALPDIPMSLLPKTIENWEKSSSTNSAIPKNQALSNFPYIKSPGLEAAYTYWINKRKKRRLPLVRQYWKSVDGTDTNLSNVFCKRKGEKMRLRNVKGREFESKMKSLKLFCNLNELKDLIIWVLRRESLKLNLERLKGMEFEYRRAEVVDSRYFDRDFEEVLREPVLEDSARFRDPMSYLNIYQKHPPKINLRRSKN